MAASLVVPVTMLTSASSVSTGTSASFLMINEYSIGVIEFFVNDWLASDGNTVVREEKEIKI